MLDHQAMVVDELGGVDEVLNGLTVQVDPHSAERHVQPVIQIPILEQLCRVTSTSPSFFIWPARAGDIVKFKGLGASLDANIKLAAEARDHGSHSRKFPEVGGEATKTVAAGLARAS